MKFNFNDGGRRAAGLRGEANDCVVRAIAIATEQPYIVVYRDVNSQAANERWSKNRKTKSNARTGVHKPTWKKYLRSLGWVCTPTMGIGTGCKVHLREGELPAGRLIVQTSRHLVAVIDGVINDTFDPSREGTRCVYGYWTKP